MLETLEELISIIRQRKIKPLEKSYTNKLFNDKKLVIEKENLEKLIFSHAATPIENPMKIKVARKFVARIKTEINNKK